MILILKEDLENDDHLFEMANKGKSKTGLPFNIYLSIQPQNKKDNLMRVKFQNDYADKFNIGNLCSLVFFPNKNFEYFIESKNKVLIKNKEIEMIIEFIKLNYNIILTYWNGYLDSEDLVFKKIQEKN